MLIIFEAVAITLWLTKDNIFYLFNFSYIGLSISLGIFLFIKKYKHARRIVQLLVGLYMLIYLGLICNENMQIEGFWYYLFTGVFEAPPFITLKISATVIRQRLVWICLLDSYGLGFSSLQVSITTKKESRMDQIHYIYVFNGICCLIVPC